MGKIKDNRQGYIDGDKIWIDKLEVIKDNIPL